VNGDYTNEIVGGRKYLNKEVEILGCMIVKKPWKEAGKYYFAMSTLGNGEPNVICGIDPASLDDFSGKNQHTPKDLYDMETFKPDVTLVGVCKGRRASALRAGYEVLFDNCRLLHRKPSKP
jgi:hypothetical protein